MDKVPTFADMDAAEAKAEAVVPPVTTPAPAVTATAKAAVKEDKEENKKSPLFAIIAGAIAFVMLAGIGLFTLSGVNSLDQRITAVEDTQTLLLEDATAKNTAIAGLQASQNALESNQNALESNQNNMQESINNLQSDIVVLGESVEAARKAAIAAYAQGKKNAKFELCMSRKDAFTYNGRVHYQPFDVKECKSKAGL